MEIKKISQFGQKLKFPLSVIMLAAVLILAAYTEDLQLRELCKGLSIAACLNLFRVITNNNLTIEK